MNNTLNYLNTFVKTSSLPEMIDYRNYMTENNVIDFVSYPVLHHSEKKSSKTKDSLLFSFYKNRFISDLADISNDNIENSDFYNFFSTYNSSSSVLTKIENMSKLDSSIKTVESKNTSDNYFEKTKDEIITEEVKKKTETFKKEIFDILCKDKYETGEFSKIDFYFEHISEDSLVYIKPALLSILSENEDDNHIIEGVLHVFSKLPYELMKPHAPTACIALFSHKSIMIKNKAIQVFEKWNSKDSVKQLENHSCSPAWVQQHLENVIKYINEFGK